MLGMIGIIVKKNSIVNTTQIMQEVKPGEKWLVMFLNEPSFARICTLEEIGTWLLFSDNDQSQAWVEASKQPKEPETPDDVIAGMQAGANGEDKQPPPFDEGPSTMEPSGVDPNEPEVVRPLNPNTEAAVKKALEPDQSSGKLPDDKGKKS